MMIRVDLFMFDPNEVISSAPGFQGMPETPGFWFNLKGGGKFFVEDIDTAAKIRSLVDTFNREFIDFPYISIRRENIVAVSKLNKGYIITYHVGGIMQEYKHIQEESGEVYHELEHLLDLWGGTEDYLERIEELEGERDNG